MKGESKAPFAALGVVGPRLSFLDLEPQVVR